MSGGDDEAKARAASQARGAFFSALSGLGIPDLMLLRKKTRKEGFRPSTWGFEDTEGSDIYRAFMAAVEMGIEFMGDRTLFDDALVEGALRGAMSRAERSFTISGPSDGSPRCLECERLRSIIDHTREEEGRSGIRIALERVPGPEGTTLKWELWTTAPTALEILATKMAVMAMAEILEDTESIRMTPDSAAAEEKMDAQERKDAEPPKI